MAVDVYSVTNAMVLARLPVDTANIGASTKPLSTAAIDTFIERGASQITAVLLGNGLSTTITNDNMTSQVQGAIIHFAVWQSLLVLPNMPSDRIAAAEKAWLDDLTRYSSSARTMVSQADSKNATNVSTSANKTPKTFSGISYEF